MTVPVATYSAQNDWLADPEDVKLLLPQLSNKMYDKYIENWDHLDFIWGLDAAKLVYYDIIKNIKTEMFQWQRQRLLCVIVDEGAAWVNHHVYKSRANNL